MIFFPIKSGLQGEHLFPLVPFLSTLSFILWGPNIYSDSSHFVTMREGQENHGYYCWSLPSATALALGLPWSGFMLHEKSSLPYKPPSAEYFLPCTPKRAQWCCLPDVSSTASQVYPNLTSPEKTFTWDTPLAPHSHFSLEEDCFVGQSLAREFRI